MLLVTVAATLRNRVDTLSKFVSVAALMVPRTHQEGMKIVIMSTVGSLQGEQGRQPRRSRMGERVRKGDTRVSCGWGGAGNRVPACGQGLAWFESSSDVSRGSTKVFPSSCPDVGQRGRGAEGRVWLKS